MNYSKVLFGLVVLCLFGSGLSNHCSSHDECEEAPQLVRLNEDNFLVIRGPITDMSASKTIEQLLALRAKDIYLYISSPGGSVFAGLQITQVMQTLEASGVRVHTIADFAASMGYIIHQYGSTRLVRPWGVLMQHQMSYGVRGNYWNVQSYNRFISQINTELTKYQSERSNVSASHFNELTQHDMWLVGQSAIDSHVADHVVDVVCDFRSDTYVEEIMTFWGPVELTFSTCPLVSAPLKVRMVDGNVEDLQNVMMMYNQSNYPALAANGVHNFVDTNVA